MATLNTTYGWSQGDQVRLLIASGLSVGTYQIAQVTQSMNDLGAMAPDAVSSVLDLIDQFELAQTNLSTLNSESSGRILTKADVLEWKESAPGASYSPERELMRIKQMIMMYFAACPVCGGSGYIAGGTSLVRS